MTAGLALVALVVAARYGRGLGAVGGALLAVASLLWMYLNQPMEGAVLVRITASHGITEADLVGVLGLALGIGQAARDLRARVHRDRGKVPDRSRQMEPDPPL